MVPLLAAVSLAAAIVGVATAAVLPPSRKEVMLRLLAAFTGTARGEADTGPVAAPESTLDRLLYRLGVLLGPPGDRQRLVALLERAGNPPEWPIQRLIRLRPLAAIAVAVLGGSIASVWIGDRAGIPGAVAGFVGGCLLPQVLVHNTGLKRQELLLRSLPDVMDALVIGVEAGLGLDAAMDQVARALRGPMADELRRVLQEMRLGVSRADALRSLSARTTVRDLKRLVTALTQAGELGISVAGILREHAQEQRTRRRQRAEEQAQKIPVKLLFPVLFCMFPAIFVVIIGPAVLTLADAFGN